ncbi:unnamed protein product [Urochloa humidicola]
MELHGEQGLGDKEMFARQEDGKGGDKIQMGGVDGDSAADVLGKNKERQIVPLQTGTEPASDEEAEFAFEEEGGGAAPVKWLAVARFYSGRNYKSKVIFSELMKAWGDVDTRDLEDNRYLLEFSSENARDFVLRGGPWQFKGDAMIVVPFDGLTRLSEIVIESIPLWIPIYDIPVGMLTSAFVKALASKVGRVLEIGESVRDFKRVRVGFLLAEALKPSVNIKVRGRGMMEFMIKYENVPYFCFVCGRIGHAERECPDEDILIDEARFGTELRSSPFKRGTAKLLSFHATVPPAKRGLNFSGSQKDRVTSFSASSTPGGSRGGTSRPKPTASIELEGLDVEEQKKRKLTRVVTDNPMLGKEIETALVEGVQKMAVENPPPAVHKEDVLLDMQVKERVSGIESYNGSTDGSLLSNEQSAAKPVEMPSMQERLHRAKSKIEQKSVLKSPGAARDIDKNKKKKGLNPEAVAASLKELQEDAGHASNLVGAHGEPHQGQ